MTLIRRILKGLSLWNPLSYTPPPDQLPGWITSFQYLLEFGDRFKVFWSSRLQRPQIELRPPQSASADSYSRSLVASRVARRNSSISSCIPNSFLNRSSTDSLRFSSIKVISTSFL